MVSSTLNFAGVKIIWQSCGYMEFGLRFSINDAAASLVSRDINSHATVKNI